MSVTLLDHRGQPIRSETTSLSRQQREALAIRARFDAAQSNNDSSRHWANADYLGPNTELDPATRRKLRSRARYECANNTYAAGMIDTLANDTIGTGPTVQAIGLPRRIALAIENRFWNWSQAIRLPLKLRTLRMTKARDGEGFASLFSNPRNRDAVQLDLQPHEPEMIAAPTWNSSNSLTDGIVLDDFGNVVAYQLLREHPGENETSFSGAADSVRADAMIHLYNQKRAGQVRGYPEITAALPLYAKLRQFTLAVIRAAESAALPSWIIKSQGLPGEGIGAADPFDTVDTERGMGMVLPAGWDMGQLKAEQPVSTYAAFKREIINEIARVLGMPYNVAAGDSSSYNFSSGRLDHKTYFKAIRVERSLFESVALDMLFRAWWAEARLVNGYLPDEVRELLTPPEIAWRWDGDEHIDPTKEVAAIENRIAIGVSSYADECAQLGKDAETVHTQNAQAMGLTLADYRARLADKLLGPKAALPAPAPPSTDDEPADDEEAATDAE